MAIREVKVCDLEGCGEDLPEPFLRLSAEIIGKPSEYELNGMTRLRAHSHDVVHMEQRIEEEEDEETKNAIRNEIQRLSESEEEVRRQLSEQPTVKFGSGSLEFCSKEHAKEYIDNVLPDVG